MGVNSGLLQDPWRDQLLVTIMKTTFILSLTLMVLLSLLDVEGASVSGGEMESDRGLFRLACFQTCSDAGFASTTECTYGGLFWTITQPCNAIFPLLGLGK